MGGMTLGVIIGGLTASIVIEWVVTLLIGMMGFLFRIGPTHSKKAVTGKKEAKVNHAKGYFWCTIAGFTSFISHTGGPPWQIFTLPLGLTKSVFVGTSVIVFSYCNVIKLIPYIWLGQIDELSIQVSIIMIIPATIAVSHGCKISETYS